MWIEMGRFQTKVAVEEVLRREYTYMLCLKNKTKTPLAKAKKKKKRGKRKVEIREEAEFRECNREPDQIGLLLGL